LLLRKEGRRQSVGVSIIYRLQPLPVTWKRPLQQPAALLRSQEILLWLVSVDADSPAVSAFCNRWLTDDWVENTSGRCYSAVCASTNSSIGDRRFRGL